jgi:hypothetical protein
MEREEWRPLPQPTPGQLSFVDAALAPVVVEAVTGRYFGRDATATERESGVAVEQEREPAKPIRPGSLAHQVLRLYAAGERLTAYEASMRHSGDWHSKRRESTRLLVRGFLVKDGTKKNKAPSGRARVDAYRITPAGLDELERLG